MLLRLGAALTYRDFRILWIGAFVSTIGTWMQKAAQNWLVLTLTAPASAFYLGLDAFLGEAPILLFTLIGGVVADRYDRRHLLIGSQLVQMTTAFTLAALVYAERVHITHVLALSFVAGMAQAFGGPAHQSLMPLLVDKRHLPNAIAFNSIQFNLARVIGPLVAGATMATLGMVACFGFNGLSFVAVIAALAALRARPAASTEARRLGQDLRGGFAYVRANPSLIGLATLGFLGTFLGVPLTTFLPLVAEDIFGGGVAQYTHLLAFAGAGAVAGALAIAWFGRYSHMGRTLLLVQLAFGVLLVLFAGARLLWLADLLLFAAAFCMMMVFGTLSSLVQLTAPDALRGRVMSIYLVAFRGGMPLGGLVGGSIAASIGAPAVLTLNGFLLIAVAAWFLLWQARRGNGVRNL